MDYSSILVTEDSQVCLVTLNRPESLNAVSDELRRELIHVIQELSRSSDTKAVVVTGAGRAFSAGADLIHVKHLHEEFRRSGLIGDYGGAELASAFFGFQKPIIAAINGVAVGWGMTMPLACDIRIASERAKFSAAFVRAGLTPEFGSSYLLPRMIGYGRAAELVFTGRVIEAREALELGLVNRVVPHDDLMSEAMNLAKLIANQPHEALKSAKALLRAGMETGLDGWLEHEATVFKERMTSEEHFQALTRLLEEIQSRSPSKSQG